MGWYVRGFDAESGIALICDDNEVIHVLMPPYSADVAEQTSQAEAAKLQQLLPIRKDSVSYSSLEELIAVLRSEISFKVALDNRDLASSTLYLNAVPEMDADELRIMLDNAVTADELVDVAMLLEAIGKAASNEARDLIHSSLRRASLYVRDRVEEISIPQREPASALRWSPPEPFFGAATDS